MIQTVADVRVGFSIAKGPMGLFSKLIMAVSGSKASHAWLVYFDERFAQEMVLEAHETGFRMIPFVTFARKNNIRRVVRPKVLLDAGLPTVGKFLGQSYDFAGLFGMIWVELGQRFKKRWKNPFRSSRSQFCSEAVCRVLRAVNYPGVATLDPEMCDPQTLWELFDADGSEVVK